MATDGLNFFIVGHNLAAECDVANAMLKCKSAFKQFTCRQLIVKTLINKTLGGENVRLVMTPNLNTPAWAAERDRIKDMRVYKKKLFVYVKDISNFDTDDKQSVRNIRRNFGKDSEVILLIYHDEETASKAEEKCKELIKMFTDTNVVCLKSSTEFNEKVKTGTKILEIASNAVQRRNDALLSKQQYKGKEYVDNRPAKRSTSTLGTASEADKEEAELLNTVPKQSAERAKTPENVTVKLEEKHWQIYHKALEKGTALSYHTRVNVVGHQGAGKTTLLRRLQLMDIPAREELPTEGLQIDRTVSRAIEIDGVRQWETNEGGFDEDLNYQRMAQAMKNVDIEDDDNLEILESHEIYSDEIIDEICIPSMNANSEQQNVDWEEYSKTAEKQRYLQRVIKKKEHSPGDRIYLAYWDFAGQSTYYTTHQAFMSPSAVYLLVVDLSKPLDFKEQGRLNFKTEREDVSVLESIRFWAGSIKAYTSNERKAVAPVIVVGTHKDKVDPKTIDTIFAKVRLTMEIDEVPCIAIDNTLTLEHDSDIGDLRDKIVDGGIGILETRIPATWIELEHSLLKRKDEGTTFLSFEELEDLDKKNDAPISQTNLLVAFLEHQHCRGFLLYFPQGDLKHLIILDPTILVKFINATIREKPKHSFSEVLQSGWCSDGVVDQPFLKDVIQGLEELGDTVNSEYEKLVQLCIHLKILYPKTKTQLQQGRRTLYFMPCLLGQKPDAMKKYSSSISKEKMTPKIKISFENKVIPPEFFQSLMSSLLSVWEPHHSGDKVRMFSRYVCFRLDNAGTRLLEMYWSKSSIYLYIINFSKKQTLKEIQCDKILKTIESHIQSILVMYRHFNIDINVGICCPLHADSYVALDDLIGYDTKGEGMCFPDHEEDTHAVTAQEILETWFPDKYTNVQDDVARSMWKGELAKQPSDKRLGRLARLLIFDEANGLATKLKMERPFHIATKAISESQNCKEIAHFKIMKYWREINGDTATTEKLLRLLTKLGMYRRPDVERELFKDVTRGVYEGASFEELDKRPTERQCGSISNLIDIRYPFLFLELDLTYTELEHEQSGNLNMRNIINKLLIKWLEKNIDTATIRVLLDTASLFNMDVNGMVKALFEKK